MVSVLLHVYEAETLEELEEVEGVLEQAGAETSAERDLLLRQVFAAGATLGRRLPLTFGRVPQVGEYIRLPLEDDTWYRVEMVLHTPAHPAQVAEIWAMER